MFAGNKLLIYQPVAVFIILICFIGLIHLLIGKVVMHVDHNNDP